MALRLYDTMSREVREVFAMDGESVRFYCCGPTVYGPAHVAILEPLYYRMSFAEPLRQVA